MEKVKILQTFYVDHTGVTHKEGDEAEVSDEFAKRHTETGFLKIIPTEKVILEKAKQKTT